MPRMALSAKKTQVPKSNDAGNPLQEALLNSIEPALVRADTIGTSEAEAALNAY